jgi:hypothetical protein
MYFVKTGKELPSQPKGVALLIKNSSLKNVQTGGKK